MKISLPAIPRSLAPEVRAFLEALRSRVQALENESKSGRVTMADLEKLGLCTHEQIEEMRRMK